MPPAGVDADFLSGHRIIRVIDPSPHHCFLSSHFPTLRYFANGIFSLLVCCVTAATLEIPFGLLGNFHE
ncbi:hypothetical protein CEXT_327601 [Caerostris extrusa]|uniref:Uncharacterized protein n=1 Tax=Caerostris extrusa TaxID=172846 RepID=A0AAV4NMG2_CAEEX|nr:hypothetical protein CEXT_327601 [Caerostris extrusa]